jgi:hypothetical protein
MFTIERGTVQFCMLIDIQGMTNFNQTVLDKKEKYEFEWHLNIIIGIWFYKDSS